MTLSQGHDTIVWYIVKIQLGSDDVRPGHGFCYTRGIWKVLHIRAVYKSERRFIQLIYTND